MQRIILTIALILALGGCGLILNVLEIEQQRAGAMAVLICDP